MDKKIEVDAAELKPIIKEAIKEWMSDNFATFGWFAVKSIAVAAFGVAMLFYLKFFPFR